MYFLHAQTIKAHQVNAAIVKKSQNEWHCLLGYILQDYINRLMKYNMAMGINLDSETTASQCEACIQGKQTREDIPKKGKNEVSQPSVILKYKNVSSIKEYNIGDRLKYSRIKQSSKKDTEESRISVKYQEHYRSI